MGIVLKMVFVAVLFLFILIDLLYSKDIKDYQKDVDDIINHALKTNNRPYQQLAFLTDTFGSRILGSPSMAETNNWLEEQCRNNKFDLSIQQNVPGVPYWNRGEEKATLKEPRHYEFDILGLGQSIPGEVTAEAIVVKSKEELDQLGGAVKGKIVIYNYEFESYGASAKYRSNGGAWAAQYGAVAALIRSVTPFGIYTTHTGMQNINYSPRILSACITIEDANMFERMQSRGDVLKIHIKMESELTYVNSTNVICDFKGSEKPEEIILLSGHIDSWDVGVGAMDDACGVINTMEAIRVLIELGKRPKRTLRFVAWAGEEYGGFGGQEYAKLYEKELKNHVFVFEMDMGCFEPYGFGFTATGDKAMTYLQEITNLQSQINTTLISGGGGGVDIQWIMHAGTPSGEPLTHNDDYFWYHHTRGDRMDVLEPDHQDLATAAVSSLAYVIADMDVTLPRNK